MKKVLAMLLAAILLLSPLTACGSLKSDKIVVNFWGHINEAWNKSHQQMIDKFNASQDEIEVVATFFPYDDFQAKIQSSFLTDQGADVYEIWGGWGLDFVASGKLSEVPEEFLAELIEDCYEPVLGAFKGNDGKYYGVPVEFNNEYGGMLVNKTKFEELGIAYPKTWDEIINVARSTTVRNGDVFEMRGLDFTTDDTLTTTFLSMILSLGGQYWVDGKFDFTTSEAEEALQTLVNYVKVDHLTNTDSATEAQGAEIDGAHFLGMDEAMMVPRGPWVISMLDEEYGKEYGVDFDYIKFPFYSSIKAFPAETGWSMCVSRNSKVTDAAWKYVEFFLEKENLMQHNINCAQIPPRRSIVEDPAFVEKLPYMAPLLDILEYGVFIGPFNTEVLKLAMRNTYVSLCTTNLTVKDALAALETKVNTDIKAS